MLGAGAGILLLACGLLCALAAVHFKGLRYYDRPVFARRPGFDRGLAVLRWILPPAGLILIGRRSWPAAASIGAVLALFWFWRVVVKSVAFQARLLRREYAAFRSRRPGAPEDRLLAAFALGRNPRWGEELVEQMVLDYPTIESLSLILARMERGFRGFGGPGKRPVRKT